MFEKLIVRAAFAACGLALAPAYATPDPQPVPPPDPNAVPIGWGTSLVAGPPTFADAALGPDVPPPLAVPIGWGTSVHTAPPALAAVPEPAPAGLLVAGLLCLAWRRLATARRPR